MKNASRSPFFRLLLLGILILVVGLWAQQRPPICEQIAKTYGLDSFPQVEQLSYTWAIDAGELKTSRSWVWEPKPDRVSYDGKDKSGKPVKVTYLRSQIGSQPEVVKTEVDPAFINDKYWLLFPLQLAWDTSANVEDQGASKMPLAKSPAKRVTVKYSSGGYTPGDSYELFVGADNRIHEWIFHRGGVAEPTLIATWAGYKKAGPLLISTEHRGTYRGKPARISLSNVSVKLVGAAASVDAQ